MKQKTRKCHKELSIFTLIKATCNCSRNSSRTVPQNSSVVWTWCQFPSSEISTTFCSTMWTPSCPPRIPHWGCREGEGQATQVSLPLGLESYCLVAQIDQFALGQGSRHWPECPPFHRQPFPGHGPVVETHKFSYGYATLWTSCGDGFRYHSNAIV